MDGHCSYRIRWEARHVLWGVYPSGAPTAATALDLTGRESTCRHVSGGIRSLISSGKFPAACGVQLVAVARRATVRRRACAGYLKLKQIRVGPAVPEKRLQFAFVTQQLFNRERACSDVDKDAGSAFIMVPIALMATVLNKGLMLMMFVEPTGLVMVVSQSAAGAGGEKDNREDG